jgi:NADH dehydrogenase
VIVGGGFGGLAAARALKKAKVRVTLIDRRNHHLFQPLLYQVATAALSAPDIAAPIRGVLRRQKNCTVLLGEAVSVDADAKTLHLQDGTVAYDYLILAAGATNHWFGNEEWPAFAPGLKSLEEALDIRRRMLSAYENAERETDPVKQKQWLTFAVIGAGPTGVEMAGALSEIARTTLTRDFRNFDPKDARVVLIEGTDKVLAAFPEGLRASAKKQLESIGVEIRLNTRVTGIDEFGVDLGDDRVDARTVVWAAGVKAEPLMKTIGSETDRMGRAIVNAQVQVPDRPEIFVIGDGAHFVQKDSVLPGVAPVALQQGAYAGEHIAKSLAGKSVKDFVYFDKGSMATIGRRRAVAMTGVGTAWPATEPTFKFTGMLAWLAWLFVHVLVLVDFRNRAAVMTEWAWAYITFQRSARVILSQKAPAPKGAPVAESAATTQATA